MRARSREVLLWCSKPWPAGCKLFWQRHLPFLLLPVVHKLWWLARCKPCTSACVSVPWALASSFIQALTPCNMLVIYPGLQRFMWRQMVEVRRPPGITNIPALCSGESRLNLPDLKQRIMPYQSCSAPGWSQAWGALPYAHRYIPQDARVPEHSPGNTIRAQFT